jgi:hypothetical protein
LIARTKRADDNRLLLIAKLAGGELSPRSEKWIESITLKRKVLGRFMSKRLCRLALEGTVNRSPTDFERHRNIGRTEALLF